MQRYEPTTSPYDAQQPYVPPGQPNPYAQGGSGGGTWDEIILKTIQLMSSLDRYTPGPQSPPSMFGCCPSEILLIRGRTVQVVHSPFARTFSDAGRAIIGRGQTVRPFRLSSASHPRSYRSLSSH